MRRTIPAGLLVLAFSLLAGLPASAAHPHGKTTFQKHFRPNLKAKFRLAGGPNYTVQFFAGGTGLYYKPDPIVVQGTSVYVAYQNGTATDGSDGGNSTIVQYNLFGAVQAITQVKGHCDGMRWNPYTNTLWILVNNDANPALYTLASGVLTKYSFMTPTMHGGGYDDMVFLSGKAFISGSNPTLNGMGINTGPAVYSVTLAGGNALVTPVLYGNATALDLVSLTPVSLNEIDPDSLSSDPAGDLLLVNQAGSEIVAISNPGTPSQGVARLLVGTQLEDTVFATNATGTLWITDSAQNAIFIVKSQLFTSGAIWTEAPNDSGVASWVGTLDPTTGIVTPQIVGFGSPTGLLFVPGP